jgi:hypothetical protein
MYECLREHLPAEARPLAAECAARERRKASDKSTEDKRSLLLGEIRKSQNNRQRFSRMIRTVTRDPFILFWRPFTSLAAEFLLGKSLKRSLSHRWNGTAASRD